MPSLRPGAVPRPELILLSRLRPTDRGREPFGALSHFWTIVERLGRARLCCWGASLIAAISLGDCKYLGYQPVACPSGARMIVGGHNMIDFIIAIVMGGIIGWLASIVMRTDAQQGIFLNIIVGCIGSILGRLLLGGFLGGGHLRGDAFDWRTLVTAFIGAIILLAIVNLIRRGRVR